ncbi:MAG TPA: hypothetical protein VGJ00_06750 [Rhabdochlamydiaceae bacterium]|jgi:hypothetical protein
MAATSSITKSGLVTLFSPDNYITKEEERVSTVVPRPIIPQNAPISRIQDLLTNGRVQDLTHVPQTTNSSSRTRNIGSRIFTLRNFFIFLSIAACITFFTLLILKEGYSMGPLSSLHLGLLGLAPITFFVLSVLAKRREITALNEHLITGTQHTLTNRTHLCSKAKSIASRIFTLKHALLFLSIAACITFFTLLILKEGYSISPLSSLYLGLLGFASPTFFLLYLSAKRREINAFYQGQHQESQQRQHQEILDGIKRMNERRFPSFSDTFRSGLIVPSQIHFPSGAPPENSSPKEQVL